MGNELTDAGFTDVKVLAVEGFAQTLYDLDARLDDPSSLQILLDALRRIEEAPSARGITGHLIALGWTAA